MAQNITLLGASYTAVPAVQLPKTGGGTAQFDDTTDANATAADIAQGKTAYVNGAKITGTGSGGGVDIPVFNDMWSSDWSTETITCDKTFAECLALWNDSATGAYLHSYVDDPNDNWEQNITITAVEGSNSQIVYVSYGALGPLADYIYHSNGTIEVVMPSAYAQSLTVTQNGYYYPQSGVYTDVTVNVPGGGGSTYSLTNIVPTQTIATTTSNLYGYVGLIPSHTAYVQSGEWYLVTYDSTEYVCTGYYGANSEIMAGDYQLLTTDVPWVETPFLVEHNLTNGYFFLGSRVSGNHTLKVDKITFLDSGVTLVNKSITTNGTYNASSDNADGFETVTVNVPSSTPNLQAKTNISPTTSSQTITADSGYDGLSSVQINAMPSGTAGTPTATKGTVSNHSITVTPSVTNTTGYITGSTKTGTAVTVSASELVSGSQSITSNNTYDVTNLASVVVNVAGGGGLTLLATKSLGTLSTSSTSASDTGQSMTVTGFTDYDVLVVDVSVDTVTNGRHTSTVSMIYVTGTSNVSTKNTYAVGGNKWNSKRSSSGTGSTRQSSSAYGVYANAATVSGSTMTIPFYYRYNSNSTGTLNGTYTARVYGLKLYDLIGG